MKRAAPFIVFITFVLASLACSIGPNISFENPFSTETQIVATPTMAPLPTQVVQAPGNSNQGGDNSSSTTIANSASALDADLAELYARLSPGVVSITILTNQGGAQGSGFVYDKQGHIITNYHVVEGATEIEVDFASGLKVFGQVIASDLDSDLVVIEVKVPESELTPLPLGDSNMIRVGQSVLAIGNPFGLSGTMTYGIISAKGRLLDSLHSAGSGAYFSSGDYLQTDAAINPGNSGGPLLNLNGEVIGINRAIQTSGVPTSGQAANIGIGYAIPINIVKRVVPVLIQNGKYDYPYLGLRFSTDLSLDDINALNLPQQTGAYIAEVIPGGPGDEAGLQAGKTETSIQGLLAGGDLVVAVDNQPVLVFNDLIGYILNNKSPGDKITLTIIRDNQQKEATLTLGKRP